MLLSCYRMVVWNSWTSHCYFTVRSSRSTFDSVFCTDIRAQASAVVCDEIGGLIAGCVTYRMCGYGTVYHCAFGHPQVNMLEKFNFSKRIKKSIVAVRARRPHSIFVSVLLLCCCISFYSLFVVVSRWTSEMMQKWRHLSRKRPKDNWHPA